MEAIIDTCLRESVLPHNVLHGFCAERGTGTAILEPKLAQELSGMYQDPLSLILLNLQKAYDTVDCVSYFGPPKTGSIYVKKNVTTVNWSDVLLTHDLWI